MAGTTSGSSFASNNKDQECDQDQSSVDRKEIFEAGVEEKTFKYEWRLRNYDTLRQRNLLIEGQHFDCQVTDSNGVKSKWRYALTSNKEDKGSNEKRFYDWIGIRRTFLGFCPSTSGNSDGAQAQAISSKACATVPTPAGHPQDCGRPRTVQIGGEFDELKPGDITFFTRLLRKDWTSRSLENLDDTLVIQLELTVFSVIPAKLNLEARLRAFEECAKERTWNNLAAMAFDAGPFPTADITIFSKEGDIFQAHWAILVQNSTVFQAMYLSYVQEKGLGMFRFDDISAKCVRTMIRYLYTGKLGDDWAQSDVIGELMYASVKYRMKELFDFLDESVPCVCTMEGAPGLLTLARKLKMKTAEKGLLEIIKTSGRTVVKLNSDHLVEHLLQNLT